MPFESTYLLSSLFDVFFCFYLCANKTSKRKKIHCKSLIFKFFSRLHLRYPIQNCSSSNFDHIQRRMFLGWDAIIENVWSILLKKQELERKGSSSLTCLSLHICYESCKTTGVPLKEICSFYLLSCVETLRNSWGPNNDYIATQRLEQFLRQIWSKTCPGLEGEVDDDHQIQVTPDCYP